MLTNPILNVLDPRDIAKIAELYASAPEDITSWQEDEFRLFVAEVAKLEAKKMKASWKVVDGQPYANADEMRADLKANKVLLISRDFNDDALLGPDVNLMFRAAHDFHHCQTANCNFELWGECCAFAKFAARANGDGWKINVLFSEIVAQVCGLRVTGEYLNQRKVAHVFAPWAIQVCQAYGVKYNL
jgi:hypothetical protein